MVSSTAIAFMLLSIVIVFGVPIGLWLYFYKSYKIAFKAVAVGALVFFVFQILLRIPLLSLLAGMGWIKNITGSGSWLNILFYALFLAFTAGIFEEVGRYLGFKFFLRKELAWKNGVAFGVGHGGAEAVLLVGFGTFNYIIYSLLINAGKFSSLVAAKLPSQVAENLRNLLVNSPPWMFGLGGVERIMAMMIHIGFSVLVLYSVMARKPRFLLYAVLLHGIVNLPAGLYQLKVLNIWITEVFVLIAAGLSWYLAYKFKPVFDKLKKSEEVS